MLLLPINPCHSINCHWWQHDTPVCHLLWKSSVASLFILASLGELLTDAGETVNECKPCNGQQDQDPGRHCELTDVGQNYKASNGDANIFPTNLIVVEEEISVLVSDDIADEGPTNVAKRKDRESQDMGGEWLITY